MVERAFRNLEKLLSTIKEGKKNGHLDNPATRLSDKSRNQQNWKKKYQINKSVSVQRIRSL